MNLAFPILVLLGSVKVMSVFSGPSAQVFIGLYTCRAFDLGCCVLTSPSI